MKKASDSIGTRRGLTRRKVVHQAILGGTGFLLAGRTGTAQAVASTPSRLPERAKAVIQIWMWGGPCHIDTFDPKPDAGYDYYGALSKPIETNVSGIRIGELLPELAKQADKYSIIRSMTHGVNAHETASYLVQTGRESGGHIVFPGAGAVVSLYRGYDAGYKGLIPPYMVLTEPLGRFSEAGFLGPRYKPFATGGDPARDPFQVEGVVSAEVGDQRQENRRALLQRLNTFGQTVSGHPEMQIFQSCREEAYNLILGDGRKVFDLKQENGDLRERYGRSTFGQSCLAARRLIENGVRFVTINYKGWDTHKQHFQVMRRMLPDMDKGLATLLQDLKDRGLLDTTLVWWGGEFGRTPRVQWEAPWNGGRGHWGNAFCALVAGGGFKGGHVLGASDARGEEVKERPVYPADLIGSIYTQLGIDPETRLPHPDQVCLIPTAESGAKRGGLLKEIM